MSFARAAFLVLAAAIYLAGVGYFNERVRESCVAASCKHGWYSKKNYPEKAQAIGWFVGGPIALGGIYWLTFVKVPAKMKSRRAHSRLKVVQ